MCPRGSIPSGINKHPESSTLTPAELGQPAQRVSTSLNLANRVEPAGGSQPTTVTQFHCIQQRVSNLTVSRIRVSNDRWTIEGVIIRGQRVAFRIGHRPNAA